MEGREGVGKGLVDIFWGMESTWQMFCYNTPQIVIWLFLEIYWAYLAMDSSFL